MIVKVKMIRNLIPSLTLEVILMNQKLRKRRRRRILRKRKELRKKSKGRRVKRRRNQSIRREEMNQIVSQIQAILMNIIAKTKKKKESKEIIEVMIRAEKLRNLGKFGKNREEMIFPLYRIKRNLRRTR